MDEIPISSLMALGGFMIGLGFGGTARWAQFCTLGAIADSYVASDSRGLCSWGLAIAVAILLTQSMASAGLIDLERSFYLSPSIGWLGAILGGLSFGIGMALVGTCGYGSLVRLGGGDLKSLVVVLVIGIFAYMTLRGFLGVLRINVIEATNLDLAEATAQDLPSVLATLSGFSTETFRWPVVVVVIAAILFFCFRNEGFRHAPASVVGGLLMGVLVSAGWAVTGVLGADEFEPARLESLTFVAPVGDSLIYLMTSTGSRLDFGIGSVAGVIAGATLVSATKGEFRIETYDSNRQMLRQLGGAALMGFGGVTALGCTVGQGITAISTLAISAPIALVSIYLGACLGLRYLLYGSLLGAAPFRRRA